MLPWENIVPACKRTSASSVLHSSAFHVFNNIFGTHHIITTSIAPISLPSHTSRTTCGRLDLHQWINAQKSQNYILAQRRGIFTLHFCLFLCFISVNKCVDMLIALKKYCVKRRTTNLRYFWSTKEILCLVFLWKFESHFGQDHDCCTTDPVCPQWS